MITEHNMLDVLLRIGECKFNVPKAPTMWVRYVEIGQRGTPLTTWYETCDANLGTYNQLDYLTEEEYGPDGIELSIMEASDVPMKGRAV
jgi:hypothetical protein